MATPGRDALETRASCESAVKPTAGTRCIQLCGSHNAVVPVWFPGHGSERHSQICVNIVSPLGNTSSCDRVIFDQKIISVI